MRVRHSFVQYSGLWIAEPFASDNYNLPEKTQYMYKLEGFNNDWLTLPLGVHNVTLDVYKRQLLKFISITSAS